MQIIYGKSSWTHEVRNTFVCHDILLRVKTEYAYPPAIGGHRLLIFSYIFADAEKDHPLLASDPTILILPHRNKMHGFDRLLNGS